MANFKPKLAEPGQPIRSSDWNSIQQSLLEEILRLEAANAELRNYIDNMTQMILIPNLVSVEGKSYGLGDPLPGEVGTYQTDVLGPITRQWVPSTPGAAVICKFGLTDYFGQLFYWAGAEKGNKKTLDIILDYVDGTTETLKDNFVHDRAKLAPKGSDNPYTEYLLSPNQWVWYRYTFANPHPEKEVRYITFRNTVPECTTRIANVFHLRVKIKPGNEPS